MPPIIDAVKAYATLGEITDVLRDVWGEYLPFGGERRSETGRAGAAYASV